MSLIILSPGQNEFLAWPDYNCLACRYKTFTSPCRNSVLNVPEASQERALVETTAVPIAHPLSLPGQLQAAIEATIGEAITMTPALSVPPSVTQVGRHAASRLAASLHAAARFADRLANTGYVIGVQVFADPAARAAGRGEIVCREHEREFFDAHPNAPRAHVVFGPRCRRCS